MFVVAQESFGCILTWVREISARMICNILCNANGGARRDDCISYYGAVPWRHSRGSEQHSWIHSEHLVDDYIHDGRFARGAEGSLRLLPK
jgi:hypothetical protein